MFLKHNVISKHFKNVFENFVANAFAKTKIE